MEPMKDNFANDRLVNILDFVEDMKQIKYVAVRQKDANNVEQGKGNYACVILPLNRLHSVLFIN